MRLLFIILVLFIVSAYTLSSSTKGQKGSKGSPGEKGSKGIRGSDGQKGERGYNGTSTSRGQPGQKGDKGDRGYPGPPGRDGSSASLRSILNNSTAMVQLRGRNGTAGAKGQKGAKGDMGMPGYNGAPGPMGYKGEKGDSSRNITKGVKGDIGPMGLRGPMGPSGYEGRKGEKGKKGSMPEIDYYRLRGEKGERGYTGEPGRPGPVGPQGPPGICVLPNGAPIVNVPGPQPGPPDQNVFHRINATTSTSGLPKARDVRYTLLQPPNNAERENESLTPGRQSYRFTSGSPVQVDSNITNLIGRNLSTPFIVTAIFKSYTGKSFCLFSVTQNNTGVLSLCIQPAGINISRVTLFTELFSPNDAISFLYGDRFHHKWTKLTLYVRHDTVDLYVNCNKQPERLSLVKNKDLRLTKDMKLQLAYSTSTRFIFQGLIEELNLYTNADDNTLMNICDQPRNIYTSNSNNFEQNQIPNEARPQPFIEYDYKKDLDGCRKEITALKKEMRDQIVITFLIRSEVIQDIEELKSITYYVTEQLKFAQNKIIELQNQINRLRN